MNLQGGSDEVPVMRPWRLGGGFAGGCVRPGAATDFGDLRILDRQVRRRASERGLFQRGAAGGPGAPAGVLLPTPATCAFWTGGFGSARSIASCSNGARESATYGSTGANSMLGSWRSMLSCSYGAPISTAEAERATALRADARMRRFMAYSC